MFSLSYAWNELRRRLGRTIVTALGLAAGVGLVMGIIGVSDGLSDAQNTVLSPLGSVGTDIIVTRTVGATTSTATTTTTTPSGFGNDGQGGPPSGAGGGFFARGGGRGAAGSLSSLNSSDQTALLNANSSVITDLAKLGKPGTKFTHDFFVPGTLITFPSAATKVVKGISGVTSAVGGLSLQALHETGTVPSIVASIKTGGQTLKTTVKPPTLTAAQQAAERACIQSVAQKAFGSFVNPTTGSGATSTAPVGTTGAGRRGTGNGRTGGGAGTFRAFGANPALAKCLTPAQKAYQAQVIVPTQTINQVLNPPTTDTATTSYTVAGIDPSSPNSGLVTKAQLTTGQWFGSSPADEVLVNTAYANTKKLRVGDSLTINSATYHIVGLVNPTLTGAISDVYFDIATLQKLSTNTSRVNEVLVSVAKSSEVSSVAAAIKKELPGAQVLTSKTLADQVTGSLANAQKLANDLGAALAIVVLLAAFLIAVLLTLSSVAKRTREIGSLRAIGWARGRVVRQIMTETLGIGVVGAVVGIAVGVGVCAIIGAIGPGLSVTSTGLAVGASTAGNVFHQTTTAAVSNTVHLKAPIHGLAILLGAGGAIIGGLVAGAAGGWRAARLVPAAALRDLG